MTEEPELVVERRAVGAGVTRELTIRDLLTHRSRDGGDGLDLVEPGLCADRQR